MIEINPLSKFLSPLISLICGEDTISVPGIICGTIWRSFPVLGSFAVQFGDHLRYWDHLRAGIICGAVQLERYQTKDLMSRTMAVRVRFESWYISLPSSAKQQREMTKFWVFWRI